MKCIYEKRWPIAWRRVIVSSFYLGLLSLAGGQVRASNVITNNTKEEEIGQIRHARIKEIEEVEEVANYHVDEFSDPGASIGYMKPHPILGEDTYVYQDDILLDNSDRSLFSTTLSSEEEESGSNQRRRLGMIPIVKPWKNVNAMFSDIFYISVYINDSDYSKDDKNLIIKVLRNLQSRSKVVQFRVKENKPNGPFIHVQSTKGYGCQSYLGKTSYADTTDGQPLWLDKDACMDMSTIAHEFLHAFGLSHEHNRPDRNKYVKIQWNNVAKGKSDLFVIDKKMRTFGVPYDLNSVMHYDEYAGTNGDGKTIVPYNKKKIGNRTTASPKDIKKLRLIYQCKDRVRTNNQYGKTPCSRRCRCWEGRKGCGNDNNQCKGRFVCQDDKCVRPPKGYNPDQGKDVYQSLASYSNGPWVGVSGYVFDVRTKSQRIKIANLWLRIEKNEEATLRIYTKQGTHIGSKYNKKDWDQLGSCKVKGSGFFDPMLLPESCMDATTITAFSVQAFYVTISNGDGLLYAPEGNQFGNTNWLQNPDLMVKEGCTLEPDFDNSIGDCSNSKGGRSFNFWGGLEYKVLG